MTTQPTTSQMIAALTSDESARRWQKDGMDRFYVEVGDFVDRDAAGTSKAAQRRRDADVSGAKVWYDLATGSWSSRGCDGSRILAGVVARIREYYEACAAEITIEPAPAPMMTLHEGEGDAPVDFYA